MENIWRMKDKPKKYPGQEQMDLGVGVMFRKFHEIEEIMIKIISTSSNVNQKAAQEQMKVWKDSKKPFIVVINSYKNLKGFEKTRFEALDNIRAGRNYFAHSYSSGDINEYGRLKTLMENIEGTLKFLEHLDKQTSAKLKKKENKIKHDDRNDLRSAISSAVKQCKKDDDGYVRLADVGNILKRQGVECKGLLKKCEELDIQCYHETVGSNVVYYLKSK